MRLIKAVKVLEDGPRTEAQRQQAIDTFRREARALRPDHPNLADELRAAAVRLARLGDVNRRIEP